MKYLLPFLFAALMGCSSLSLAPATSFEEKLAYAYSLDTSLRLSASSALQAGAIKVDDAQTVLSITDQARAALDAARVAGDPSTAASKLALATSLLTQLQQYLLSKGVK